MIPFELITLLGSTVLGGVMKLFGARMEAKRQEQLAIMQALSQRGELIREAREHENQGYQWTRRAIALLAILSIIVWPKFAPVLLDPSILVTVGWTEFSPGFFFQADQEVLTWKTAHGIILTPLDTHLVMAIIGLYFGGSLTGRSR